ncbi:MAG: 5-oxoprolinase subunit PxpB [Janthinobacterium lividum]
MPTEPPWRILPMGDRCLLVEFGHRVERRVNDMVNHLCAHLLAHMPPGVDDVVPAFCVLALHYHPGQMERGPHAATPYAQLRDHVEALLLAGIPERQQQDRIVEIPVCYGGLFGPDLAEVATRCALSEDEVIALHTGGDHAVYMLGFAPGHPYIGGLDQRLMLPRRATPRLRVEQGSVAIANAQSVIYSLASPGGWNLIGRTPLQLFDAGMEPPCLLMPGDVLRFVAVPHEMFATLQAKPRAVEKACSA